MRIKDLPRRREKEAEDALSSRTDLAQTQLLKESNASSVEKMNQIIHDEGDDDDGEDDVLKGHHHQGRGLLEEEEGGREEEEEEEEEEMEVSDGNGSDEENVADAVNRQGAEGTTLAECNNAPFVTTTAATTTTTSPPSPPPHTPPPALPANALTEGLHPAFRMHGTNRSYLPSHMFSSAVAGMTSPAVAPSTSSSSSASRASADKESAASPVFDAFRDGGGAGGVGSMAVALGQYRSPQGDPSAASTAAASYYASRLQQEGFPYGLSGVPSMSSYGYHNELYNYVSNGFPRKSRICSYCSKVFTRSTTRRYHEKRCPLLRAAGSLIQGTSGAKAPALSSSNGPVNDVVDVGLQGSGSGSRPPPLVLGSESPSPPPQSASSTSAVLSSSLATSMSLASLARSHALNSSPFYHLYGSHALTTTMSTSAASALTSAGATSTPPPQSSVDQNRNSVLSAVKKMSEQEAREGKEADTDTAESDLIREKAGSQGQEAGERPPQQQSLFSPQSTTSRTPSEEDRGSEEGESVPLKQLPSVTPRPDPSLMAIPPFLTSYYQQLATLRAAHSMAARTDRAAFPLAPFSTNVTSSAGEPRPLTSSDAQEVREDKEEGSPREDDRNNQEDEDTDNYSYSNPNTDIQEPCDAGEGKKKCGICEQEFTEEKQLVTHASVHQKFIPYCCRFCGQEFTTKAERVDHQRSHKVKCTLECVVCGTMMQTKFALRQHVRRKHGAPSAEDVPCRICRLSLAGVRNLYDHLLSHRRLLPQSAQLSLHYLSGLLACPLPVGGLDSDEEEEEASQDIPPASIDSKTSQDSPEGQRSEASVLSGPIPSSPAPASVIGDSPVQVNGGRETGSTREKEWCRMCQKEFPKSYMRYHEKEHADQKPYECSICKKRFGYKNNMKSHMKLHAGIKPYQCKVCMAKFTRGSTLRRHFRRHGFDVYPGNASSREAAMLNQASAHPAAALMGRKATSGSPPVAGSRAMKADPALLVSMGKQEMAGAGKVYDTSAYPSSDAAHQNMLEMFRTFPQAAMLQHCLPQQYLSYGTGFPAMPPAAVRPQQNEQPVDFSMPGKKRQRNHSSSSSTFTPTTSQGLAFQSALASRLSPASSQSTSGNQLVSSSALMGSSRSQSKAGDRDGKAGEKGEEAPRSSASYHPHQYHPKQRASLYETVERLMENHSNKEASSQPFSQNVTKKETPPRSAVQDAASPPPSGLEEFSKRNGVPDTFEDFSPREVAMYGMRKPQDESPSKNVAQDSSTQVALCCPQPSSSSRSSEQHRRDSGSPSARSASGRDPLQQETIGSLIQSGRLFCCSHCDCYFSDYTMYRLHCKMHPADHPFVCFLCQLDCKDRTAFASHMLNHLQ